MTPSCGDTSCEETLTCYCTTPATGDAAIAGECTSIEATACIYAGCVDGLCAPKSVEAGTPCEGGTCDGNGNCTSDACEADCDAICQSCTVPGSEGTCTTVAEGTDPEDECAGDAACDGAGACNYAAHLWSKRFGSEMLELVYDMTVDQQGNIVIVGIFDGSSSIDFGGGALMGVGGTDMFVAKFDADGNHLWSQRYGDASVQEVTAVATDSTGNVILGGGFEGTVNFGGANLTNAIGGPDIFVAKLSSAGAHLWSKAFAIGGTSSSEGRLYDLAVDGTDSVLLTGSVDEAVNFGGRTLMADGIDAYLVKLDASGNHVWSDVYPGVGLQEGRVISAMPTGDIVVAGSFTNSITLEFTPLTAVGTDIFFARFSANGNHSWSTRFGNAVARATSIAVDSAGRILLGGYFDTSIDFGGGRLLAAGASDGFLTLFDGTGVHQWSERFGSAPEDHIDRVAFDSHGYLLVAGTTEGSVDLGGGPLTSTAVADVFFGKLDPSGSHVWSRIYGAPLNQAPSGVAAGHGDAFIAGGVFGDTINFGGRDLPSAGLFDAFLVALGP